MEVERGERTTVSVVWRNAKTAKETGRFPHLPLKKGLHREVVSLSG